VLKVLKSNLQLGAKGLLPFFLFIGPFQPVLSARPLISVDTVPWNSSNTLTVGAIYTGTSGRTATSAFRASALGINLGMSTSFVLSWLAPQRTHKLRFGDIFSGELLTGYHSPKPTYWAAYRFQIGLTTFYEFSRSTAAGINVVPLVFAHDQISPNTSGSSLSLWLRVKRIYIETGVEARKDRFTGFVRVPQMPDRIPHQFNQTIEAILRRNRLAGVKLTWFSSKSFSNPDPLSGFYFKRFAAFRVFYGMSF